MTKPLAQVIENSFLEDINSMLTSGEVANLYAPEELSAVREAVRNDVRAAGLPELNDTLWSFFIERVRTHLHVVLCMSPIGASFRNYVRMFPALFSCTTTNWFSDWPPDALKEVALRFLEEVSHMIKCCEMCLNERHVDELCASGVPLLTDSLYELFNFENKICNFEL